MADAPTPDDLDRLLALPAGHEDLERAVAERVLGWRADSTGMYLGRDAGKTTAAVWPEQPGVVLMGDLTTTWAGAGLVEAAMRARGFRLYLNPVQTLCGWEYGAAFVHDSAVEGADLPSVYAEPPEAVAKAALKAVWR